MNSLGEVVKKYRTDQSLTLEKFGQVIGSEHYSYSKQAISQWEHNETKPGYFGMVHLALKGKEEWIKDFALEVLTIIAPETWG